MVDGRLTRISQLWLWTLAGAALVGVFVFVFAVAPSLLIGPPPKGLSAADELKAENDVRTTLVQALGGLAVAGGLLVTYRTYRQNRAEQDRTYQANQTEQQHAREEQDRTYERELYAKAIEQLGHEKAPVRLGALYSLERLAQDKPERRAVIVDVICAYLRMPFSPTAPGEPDGKVASHPAKRTETESRINETDDTWRQERQVRLTVQRILAKHLRDDRAIARRLTDPPSTDFWPGIRLDLSGATLIDFDLEKGSLAEANFGGATFSGDAWFREAAFGHAQFRGATFSGRAQFGGAAFVDNAMFVNATFSSDAEFNRAAFVGDAIFVDATFTGAAWFEDAAFGGGANFGLSTFSSYSDFRRAIFGGAFGFRGITFLGRAAGGDGLIFDQSRVLSPDGHEWPEGWRRVPDGKGGYTVARANDASRS
jgi:hypothetical protein